MKMYVACLFLFACGDVTPPLPTCSPALMVGATASQGPQGSAACSEAGAIMIVKASDLSVNGLMTIGPAMTFTGAAGAHGIDFVVPMTSLKSGLEPDVVILVKKGNAPAHSALVSNVMVERGRGLVHFHATDGATFQAALPLAAGQSRMRHFNYRAIGGVSMGGFGSSTNFWANTDQYDAIGVMGADPGPDMTYTLGMIHDYFIAGFCTAASGKLGQLCPPDRQPLTDQMEVPSSFEAFPYQAGSGVGLTLKRDLYVRANRDLARSMGNAAYYNPDSPYLPPGVPSSVLAQMPSVTCATPIKLKKFFDARFNPDGSKDVITFCDGNDSDANGLGKFDPSVPAVNPTQILLAVDLNSNGKRDSGEPIIVQSAEPWKDVGTDGLADANEPGYDATNNPDPNGDDYHYLWNPTGTENNWRYDQGEPFDDLGIDGVPAQMGSCAYNPQTNCWDFGEGNGKWDMAPGYANWRKHDPRGNLEALTADQFSRIDFYYDAGIRDFFNAQVSTNSLMGAATGLGLGVRGWDGFPLLNNMPYNQEDKFDVRNVDFSLLGRRVYVRYGNPDLSQATVEATGDGRHVGTGSQAVHRAQMLFYWLSQRWPDGDRKIPNDTSSRNVDDMITLSNGRVSPYTLVTPPGYDSPENANLRYPVIYFGHGLGMQPTDLGPVIAVFQNAMLDDKTPEEKRLPKFLFVVADARCRPGGEVRDAPLPTDGDLCEEGAFYTDHPEGSYIGEKQFVELQHQIEAQYRVKAPADVMVSD
jgi:hypothetical protein